MKFTLTKGVWVNEVPMDKRGTILSSTKEATDLRQKYASLSPRLAGKKLKKEEK